MSLVIGNEDYHQSPSHEGHGVVTFEHGKKKLNLVHVTENQYGGTEEKGPDPAMYNDSRPTHYNKTAADQKQLFLDILNSQCYHYDPVIRTSDDRRYYNLNSSSNFPPSSSPAKLGYSVVEENPYFDPQPPPAKDFPDPVPIRTTVNLVDSQADEHKGFIVKPEKEFLTLSPSEIFYSTDCIHPYFRNGKYLADTFTDILSGFLKVAAMEPLTVMEWHSKFWAISGNRRLYLYKKLEAFGLIHQVKVLKVQFVESIFVKKLTSRNDGVAVFVHGEPYMDQKLDQLVVESMKGPWEKITTGSRKTNSRTLRLELRNGTVPMAKASSGGTDDDSEFLNPLTDDEDDDAEDDFTPLSNTQTTRVMNDGSATVTFSQIPKESPQIAQRWKWARRVCGVLIFLLCLGFVISIIHVAALIFKQPNNDR